ncbi:hypothetical protein ONZ45_g17959 [Pleurotus djamor]|nr:hypothetical protein ONZ45_g17959 [Pleurotus djamor]
MQPSPSPIVPFLEELQLIQYSLLPNETITCCEDAHSWNNSSIHLEEYKHLCPFNFTLKSIKSNIWFEVTLPENYPEQRPEISVKGEDISRQDQERWQTLVQAKLEELVSSETEYPLYNLISLYLLPELHAEAEELMSNSNKSSHRPSTAKTTPEPPYHVLFTSHHLISPTKRRNLHTWSSNLSLSGFAKLGYPGCIYAQGSKEDIEEFVRLVKEMQWLALKVRFVEPLTPSPRRVHDHEGESASGTMKPPVSTEDEAQARLPSEANSSPGGKSHWVEFEKVGEVVEEMKRLGRGEFIVQMGIGSLGSSSTSK